MRYLLGVLASAVVTVASGWQARAAELSIACSALGREYEICREGVEAWARQTGHSVRVVSTPSSASERLALYQQLLAAGAADVDVFQIDVVWTGILADHLVDLGDKAGDQVDRHFPAIIANNTVSGRLVAMPWFADAGLLFYRADLLETYDRPLPATWADLSQTARIVQDGERAAGRDGFWGFVWQGRAYEGLTVNGLEWISSYGGGTIIDEAGAVTIDNPRAAEALAMAASWVGTISPDGVLNYSEEESRGVFQSGQALFMRNWPYAWALVQSDGSPVAGKVGVARLPKGGSGARNAAALGGQQLAVSRYSRHPDIAADLVLYLTGPQEQKRRAIAGAFNPTIVELFGDPDIAAVVPFLGDLRDVLADAVARPSTVTGRHYNRVSAEFFQTVHQVLSGRSEPQPALFRLARTLERIGRRGWSR